MGKKDISFQVEGENVFISRPDWPSVATTTYREDYYKELSSHSWWLSNGYPYNTSLGGGLHRYIMMKWYGEEVLLDMTNRGFVVDHMNNNHMDCRICNLEFLKKNRNTAKGQLFDKENPLQRGLAISLFKDFKTNCYQITIGCNDAIRDDDNDRRIHAIKLLYDKNYPLVILDAEKILTSYEEENRIVLTGLSFCDKRVNYAPDITLSEEEEKQAIVVRDGVPYLVLGNGNTYLDEVHYEENWFPPHSQNGRE